MRKVPQGTKSSKRYGIKNPKEIYFVLKSISRGGCHAFSKLSLDTNAHLFLVKHTGKENTKTFHEEYYMR